MLRESQDDAEERGYYSEAVHGDSCAPASRGSCSRGATAATSSICRRSCERWSGSQRATPYRLVPDARLKPRPGGGELLPQAVQEEAFGPDGDFRCPIRWRRSVRRAASRWLARQRQGGLRLRDPLRDVGALQRARAAALR